MSDDSQNWAKRRTVWCNIGVGDAAEEFIGIDRSEIFVTILDSEISKSH
jgi:hypothetical protein